MISIKTSQEIQLIREGGKILAAILDEVVCMVAPGVSTQTLDEYAQKRMREMGGEPAFLGFEGRGDAEPYPSALCTSINSEIVHAPAIPGRILKEGDIISIDVGLKYPIKNGARAFITDMATTVTVGRVSPRVQTLVEATRQSLEKAISIVRNGATVGDIGRAVSSIIKPHGFGIVRDFVGHGVGYELHEEPEIPNYVDKRFAQIILKTGMCICIEPMITIGDPTTTTKRDGWTVATVDGSIAAHFEHTLAVTDDGCEVLTALK